jgi:hypothetical protein
MQKSPREVVAPATSLRTVIVIATAAAVAFVLWFVLKHDDSTKSAAPKRAPAVAASVQTLSALPKTVGHDVFWAGRRAGFTYELTKTSDGRVYIRYLPAGTPVGSDRSDFLTVGTYRVPHAFQNLQKVAASGSPQYKVPGGAIAVPSKVDPRSVYLARATGDIQVEVYDPSASRALSLARSGAVSPIP